MLWTPHSERDPCLAHTLDSAVKTFEHRRLAAVPLHQGSSKRPVPDRHPKAFLQATRHHRFSMFVTFKAMNWTGGKDYPAYRKMPR